MWSVTEERVEQLIRLMNEKKHEHDALKDKHIHQLWTEDLDGFDKELKDVWAKEENERVKLGGVKNNGKANKKGGKRKAAPAKKGANGPAKTRKEPENQLMAKKV